MPNWTSNRIEAPAEVLKKYINNDKNGKPRFDFNLVIPRPEIYNDPELTCGFDTDWCIYWYLSDRGRKNIAGYGPLDDKALRYCIVNTKDYYRRGEKYVKAQKEYGYSNWYNWSNDNWGTKWNACDSYIYYEQGEPKWVEFETAWCYPEPIVRKIFEENPGCQISFYWTDEDYDGNHWMVRNEDGIIIEGCEFDEHHYDEN